MTQWGEKIIVDNHCKPEWLADDEQIVGQNAEFGHSVNDKFRPAENYNWYAITHFRLPADHPYYTATNAGFIYWPGGTMAPHDWDGWIVLLRNGRRTQPHPGMKPLNWSHDQYGSGIMDSDIIGYKKKVETVGIDGIPYSDVLRILDAVKAGDMEAARSFLPPDPVVERARDILKQYAVTKEGAPLPDDCAYMKAVIHALREGMGDA